MKSQRKKSDRPGGAGRRNLRNFVEKEFVPVEWVRPGVSLHEVKELREAFEFFDNDKTGIIDAAEVLENYRDLGFDESNARIFQIILDIEDPEKMHKMTFEDFFQIMTENLNEGSSAENFEKMFRLIDTNSDGWIDFQTMKELAAEAGDSITDQEINDSKLFGFFGYRLPRDSD